MSKKSNIVITKCPRCENHTLIIEKSELIEYDNEKFTIDSQIVCQTYGCYFTKFLFSFRELKDLEELDEIKPFKDLKELKEIDEK